MSSYGRSPPNIDGMISLKVDNLTYRTTHDELRRIFERYGEIGDIHIPRHRRTRESQGFAFVRFHDKRDAQKAMNKLDGHILDGRELRIQMARRARPTSPVRGSGGGWRNGRSGSRDRYRRRSRSTDRYRGGASGRRSYSRSRSRSRDRSRSASKSSRGKDSRSRSPA